MPLTKPVDTAASAMSTSSSRGSTARSLREPSRAPGPRSRTGLRWPGSNVASAPGTLSASAGPISCRSSSTLVEPQACATSSTGRHRACWTRSRAACSGCIPGPRSSARTRPPSARPTRRSKLRRSRGSGRPSPISSGVRSAPLSRNSGWRVRAEALSPSLLLGVGAAFDFQADAKQRAPQWMRRAGLEWAHRLAHEPRRLAWRYLSTNSEFVVRGALELSRRGRAA